MAIMRIKEMRELSVEQIDDKIKQLYTDYAKMKSQVRSGGAPENSGKMHNLRKTIARLETIKHQKNVSESVDKVEAKVKSSKIGGAPKAAKAETPKAERTKAAKMEKAKTPAKKAK